MIESSVVLLTPFLTRCKVAPPFVCVYTLGAFGSTSFPRVTMSSTPTREFKLGLVQMAANADDHDALPDAMAEVRKAAALGAQVVVLPELFRAPYFCQTMTPDNFRYAETIPGPSTDALGLLAAELQVVIVASLFERAAPGLYYNTTVVLDADGTCLGKYRKSHIPDDPLYYEKFHFTPGDTGYQVFDTRYARVGVLICWDQWYPEAARITAMLGAEVIVYPTAIGTIDEEGPEQHRMQREAWQTVQRGHAIANGLYVAAVNRVGREGELGFWGHSFACGPQGEFLTDMGAENAGIAVVSCDLRRTEDTRNIWPYFRDRRIDTYAPITRRYIREGL
jgi:N-carbamoylputrescine amidase